MNMNPRLLIAAAALGLAWLGWSATDMFGNRVDASEMRNLSNYRVESLPVDISSQWRQQLDQIWQAQGEVALLDPRSLSTTRSAINQLAWIDPLSVQVQLSLPDGIRVEFQPRRPMALVRWHGKNYAVSSKGFVIPDGLPPQALKPLPIILLEDDAQLPPAGKRVADPLVQSALHVCEEFLAVKSNFGLDLVGIERMPGYPRQSPGVPPALAFVTRNGKRILWGRSDNMRDPLAIPLDQKVRRLTVIVKDYPNLDELGQVHLHTSKVRLFSPSGDSMTLPSMPSIADLQ
jgi:hypothetical protein